MKLNQFKTGYFFLSMLMLPVAANANEQVAEEDLTVCEAQDQQTRQLMQNMLKNDTAHIQNAVNDPPDIEEGCLDGMMGIDLSMFTTDPTAPYDAILEQILEQIKDKTCKVFVNAWNAELMAGVAAINDELTRYNKGGRVNMGGEDIQLWGVGLNTTEDGSWGGTYEQPKLFDTEDLLRKTDAILEDVIVEGSSLDRAVAESPDAFSNQVSEDYGDTIEGTGNAFGSSQGLIEAGEPVTGFPDRAYEAVKEKAVNGVKRIMGKQVNENAIP